MLFGYVAAQIYSREDRQQVVEKYAAAKNLQLADVTWDEADPKLDWDQRALQEVIDKAAEEKGSLVVYEGSDLAKSMANVLDVLMYAFDKNVAVHFAKYDAVCVSDRVANVKDLLDIMYRIEKDFVLKRTTEALARRREAGLPLGRPRGKLNKYLKLDKHKKDIKKYIELNVSKASIAKLIGCHPQTLYNYITKRMKETVED